MSWKVLSLVAIWLALLSLTAQAGAPPLAGCCLCDCSGQSPICRTGDPNDCAPTCSGGQNNSCQYQGLNATCPNVPECAGLIPAASAPLAGPTGMTALAALLGGFGIYQAARRARRS